MTAKGTKQDYSKPETIGDVKKINSGELEIMPNGLPVKKPGKRPDALAKMTENTNPGDNARYLRHTVAMWNLPVLDISDPEAVQERIGWYFMHCAEADMKPTVTGLALSLGVSKDTLHDWTTGRSRKGTHMEMIRMAKMIIEDQLNSYMENGKINPVAGIFLLKNHFGYKDQQETIITPNMSMGEDVDATEMKNKYLDKIGDDED